MLKLKTFPAFGSFQILEISLVVMLWHKTQPLRMVLQVPNHLNNQENQPGDREHQLLEAATKNGLVVRLLKNR
jgi:hypothetical protein